MKILFLLLLINSEAIAVLAKVNLKKIYIFIFDGELIRFKFFLKLESNE